jgi:hypothetical protein
MVSALYNARADRILESTMAPDGDGYTTHLAVDHRGEWELRFDVRRGSDHFTAKTRVEAEPDQQSPAGGGI